MTNIEDFVIQKVKGNEDGKKVVLEVELADYMNLSSKFHCRY